MGLEPDALQEIQEALNQPVRKVKELLSSLAASPPTALSIPPSQVSTYTVMRGALIRVPPLVYEVGTN